MRLLSEEVHPIRKSAWLPTQDRALALCAAALAILAVAALLLFGRARLLEILYPLAAVVVAGLLHRYHPVTYVGYVWWLFFLTPHVRRLVDLQTGYTDLSPVMLAPYLAVAFAALPLLRSPGLLRERPFLPFGLALAGIAFGYGVGLLRNGALSSSYDLLQWALPVLLGLHTALLWRRYPALRTTLQRTFVWGALLMGVYGTVQFFALPAWDRLWMTHAGMSSIGRPEPLQVRVFSTLNSPGPYAMVMMAAALLLVSARGFLARLALAPAYLGLLLSLVRSAWGGWLVGLVYLLTCAPRGARQGRTWIAALCLAALVAVPVLTVPALQEAVLGRVDSIGRLGDDHSLQERLDFFGRIKALAFVNPLGMGLGSSGRATKLTTGSTYSFDNGLAHVPYTLGWPGGLLFAAAVVLLSLSALRGPRQRHLAPPARRPGAHRHDGFATAARAVALAMVAQLLFVNTLIGVEGVLFWCFIGAATAHRLWSEEQAVQHADEEPTLAATPQNLYVELGGRRK